MRRVIVDGAMSSYGAAAAAKCHPLGRELVILPRIEPFMFRRCGSRQFAESNSSASVLHRMLEEAHAAAGVVGFLKSLLPKADLGERQ